MSQKQSQMIDGEERETILPSFRQLFVSAFLTYFQILPVVYPYTHEIYHSVVYFF